MDWQDCEEYNKVQIFKFEFGIICVEVFVLFGVLDIIEVKMQGSCEIQVMFYCIQYVCVDGFIMQDECMLLLFENEVLVVWGEGVY